MSRVPWRHATTAWDPVMQLAQSPAKFRVTDLRAWKDALQSSSPILVHLNADTTWLIQLPYPASVSCPPGRSRFNILVDPWLQGTQSDIASWFSTQWHVVDSSMQTIGDLEDALRLLESNGGRSDDDKLVVRGELMMKDDELTDSPSHIDALVISHEFTDHCHQATLLQLPAATAVFATKQAACLIRTWQHFDTITTIPAFSGRGNGWDGGLGDTLGSLPSWMRLARAVTPDEAVPLHSAVIFLFGPHDMSKNGSKDADAIIYSPHGIKAAHLMDVTGSGFKTLALLHGLSDVQIRMAAQLNLGGLNGRETARKIGAKHWIATHDEVKAARGLVSWFLRRKMYAVGETPTAEESKTVVENAQHSNNIPGSSCTELASGEAMVLS